MRLTISLLATLACTQAITLKTTASVNAGWGSFSDAFDDIEDGFDTVVDGFGGGWSDMVDIISRTADELAGAASDILDLTAEIVGHGNDIWRFNDWDKIWDNIDAMGDGFDWIADGDNWGALGKTLGTGALLALTGDFEAAGDLLGNEDLYTGEGYDQIERKKE